MTDAEINLAIAKIEYPKYTSIHNFNGAEITVKFYMYHNRSVVVDYVNNWSDIGPIIEREKITVDFWDDKQWMAHNNRDTPFVKTRAETPTKAAALCYLKMKGE